MDYLDAVVSLDGGFEWWLVAFGVFALAALVAMLSRPWVERFTLERAVCPRDGRPAWLVLRRGRSGGCTLVSCSLGGSARHLACGRECLQRPESRNPGARSMAGHA